MNKLQPIIDKIESIDLNNLDYLGERNVVWNVSDKRFAIYGFEVDGKKFEIHAFITGTSVIDFNIVLSNNIDLDPMEFSNKFRFHVLTFILSMDSFYKTRCVSDEMIDEALKIWEIEHE